MRGSEFAGACERGGLVAVLWRRGGFPVNLFRRVLELARRTPFRMAGAAETRSVITGKGERDWLYTNSCQSVGKKKVFIWFSANQYSLLM